MTKSILAALIAATMLSPIAASAQEARARSERSIGDRAAFRQQRQENRAQRQEQRQAFRAQRQQQREGGRPEWRQQRQAQAPRAFQSRDEARRAYRQERRDDRRDFRQERREDRRALAQGDVTRQQFRRDRRDDARDYRRDRADDRRDFRRDWGRNDGRDWNRGRNWGRNDWGNRDWNRRGWGRGGWDRGWRNDRRYDWSGWRARNRYAYRLPRYYPPRGYGFGYRRYGIGVTLGSILFAQNYWINDPWAYRLPPADGPYRWVRYYNDALLVDIDTGEVVDVIHDIFW